jgi:hypothetical protein
MSPTLLLVSLALSFPCDVPRIDDRAEHARDFATLTGDEIRRLDGTLFTVVIDSPEMEMPNGSIAYECVSADRVSRCVWFQPDEEIPQAGKLMVRGRLQVIHHPPSVHGGVLFEGFTEYRVLQARLAP